ncbi:ABC transporter permease [Dactylosporangium sp. NPDC049525]|uniref:ABC transporter permease n=1 Tax=Dactylosporangium sp. NPDC049525 TaxID=3154730 RepID=UPI003417AAF4
MSGMVWLTVRRLKVFVRQPAFLFIMLIQPAIWLFLFGNLFRRVVELPGFGTGSYLDYLVPGVVVMSAVSSNMWSGMGVLEEIDRGTMNRFLITPVNRGAILNAAVVEQAISTTVQSLIIVLLGMAAGASFPGVLLIVASVLLGTVFSAFSNTIGMLVRQRETLIGLNTLLLLPLTFLSSAFIAKDLMPGWMQAVAAGNPVNWALEAGRASPDLAAGGGLLALAAAMVWLSTRTFRTYQKAV